MPKPAVNDFPIHELLRERWSPRCFSSQPIEMDKLLSLFEAARWAPSSSNLQPWAFIVSQVGEEHHQRFVDLLSGRNPQWAKNAPVLVLAVVQRDRQPGKPNYWGLYDLGQAVAHLTVQGSALGLVMRQMGGFDREKAREVFDLPEGYDPVTAIAIGYHDEMADLPEELRASELNPRIRKPLASFVFNGRWDEPLRKSMNLAQESSAGF